MNKHILILATTFLAACSPTPPMTNDEIIVEVKKCEVAGMKAVLFSSGMDWKTHTVECRPRNEK